MAARATNSTSLVSYTDSITCRYSDPSYRTRACYGRSLSVWQSSRLDRAIALPPTCYLQSPKASEFTPTICNEEPRSKEARYRRSSAVSSRYAQHELATSTDALSSGFY
jgi:hypothetical protein